MLVDEKNVDYYLLNNWKWNEGRYGVQRSLRDIVDSLNKVLMPHPCSAYYSCTSKEMASIDNSMKAKLNNYNLVKGSLVQMQRKKM